MQYLPAITQQNSSADERPAQSSFADIIHFEVHGDPFAEDETERPQRSLLVLLLPHAL